jgi:hypothetical protein
MAGSGKGGSEVFGISKKVQEVPKMIGNMGHIN